MSLIRTQLVQQLRTVFSKLRMTEVIPLLMSLSVPTEPTIYPFRLDTGQFLATSPEGYMKRAIASGVGDCFAISPSFRNMESMGRWHRPEFLMAEWYQQDTDWLKQMEVTQKIISSLKLAQQYDLPPTPWLKLSWIELWKTHINVDLTSVIEDFPMTELAKSLGYSVDGATWEQLFNQIGLNEIEPHFPVEPFFLTDFPARLSPLSKPQASQPYLAERFELLIDRVELANGCTEWFDEIQIRQQMELEQLTREDATPIDTQFLQTLHSLQGQQWAGVAVGVDRLAAFLSNSSIEAIQTP